MKDFKTEKKWLLLYDLRENLKGLEVVRKRTVCNIEDWCSRGQTLKAYKSNIKWIRGQLQQIKNESTE